MFFLNGGILFSLVQIYFVKNLKLLFIIVLLDLILNQSLYLLMINFFLHYNHIQLNLMPYINLTFLLPVIFFAFQIILHLLCISFLILKLDL